MARVKDKIHICENCKKEITGEIQPEGNGDGLIEFNCSGYVQLNRTPAY